jgi:hypothetical protein
MLSMPPAITNLASPSLTALSARPMAAMPDRHTLLIVTEGTVIGRPPRTAACLAVI